MNNLKSLTAVLVLGAFLVPTADAQLTIGRQPQADRQPRAAAPGTARASLAPRGFESTAVQSKRNGPLQMLKLLEELEQAYANHAMIMSGMIDQVPLAARTDIESAMVSAEQNRQLVAARRNQLIKLNPRLKNVKSASPTATGTPQPPVARPGLQQKRDARQKAAIDYKKAVEKQPVRRFRQETP